MANKPWKLENWLHDVQNSGQWGHVKEYEHLSLRGMIILVCSEIDLALAELIAKRLRGTPGEINDFLGADENGRAPAGSFGARIQLSYLLDIIDEIDLDLFRQCKSLRNIMAHRVTVDFNDPKVQGIYQQLRKGFFQKAARAFGKLSDDNRLSKFDAPKDVGVVKELLSLLLQFFRLQFWEQHETCIQQISEMPKLNWQPMLNALAYVKIVRNSAKQKHTQEKANG